MPDDIPGKTGCLSETAFVTVAPKKRVFLVAKRFSFLLKHDGE